MDKSSRTKHLLWSKYSLAISNSQLSVFIKEYNNYRTSLKNCVENIHNNPEDFYNFIIEHTEIPLFKNVRNTGTLNQN